MPDEAPTPVEETPQDTSTEAAVEETKPADDVTPSTDNWEQRYNDLRPEFDRRNALLTAAEGHQGPEAQAQALRQLGVEVDFEEEEEPEEDETWVDPDERFDRLEKRLAERDEEAEAADFAAREEAWLDNALTEVEAKEGLKLSQAETKIVLDIALANRNPQNGEPNVQGAVEALKESWTERQANYRASKKSPAAPVGSTGEAKVDFSNDKERRKFMAEDLASRMEES